MPILPGRAESRGRQADILLDAAVIYYINIHVHLSETKSAQVYFDIHPPVNCIFYRVNETPHFYRRFFRLFCCSLKNVFFLFLSCNDCFTFLFKSGFQLFQGKKNKEFPCKFGLNWSFIPTFSQHRDKLSFD